MREACTTNTTIRTITGGSSVLHSAVLARDEAGGTSEVISCFGDEVGIAIYRQAAALAVSVVCEIAIISAVFYI